MGIYNDRLLKLWGESGGLKPFTLDNINPASVDLTWSGRWRFAHTEGWSHVCSDSVLYMEPGKLYLLDTAEVISIPNDCAGILALKSSIGRMGIEHLHAGFFDPGFVGTATLEMENRAPFQNFIRKGQRIVQLALYQMTEAPMRSYAQTGRYMNQDKPQEAK